MKVSDSVWKSLYFLLKGYF